MGEAGGAEEKGRPDTKPFRKSCDKSKIWMWQWLDNTQYSLTSPTASKYIILKQNGHISNKWYMIIQVSIVLSGTVDRNWCFDNAHENDDYLVVKTLVAVNNSPTQDYNVHSPDKSYSTLLKYYRQPNISLAINCTWKCLSLSAIKGINLLTDLTFSLPKKKTLRCATENS